MANTVYLLNTAQNIEGVHIHSHTTNNNNYMAKWSRNAGIVQLIVRKWEELWDN